MPDVQSEKPSQIISDTASIKIAKPAAEVFAFLSDPGKLNLWSFGTWQTEINHEGLVKGTSIHSGQTNYVSIQAHPEQGLIDYLVGPSPATMQARIFARVISAAQISAEAEHCLLLLTALRTADMDEQRWHGLKTAHAFEVTLIKSLLETGYDHRSPPS